MNMNNSYPTTMYESILAYMYVFLVLYTIFAFYHEKAFKPKLQKNIFLPEICTFGQKYSHTLLSENRSSCSCKCFSLKFTQHPTVTQTESNQEVTKKMTDKHAADYSKAVCWDVN